MKKKNIKLGKLNLSKSSIASLGDSQKIVGGSVVGPNCSGACPPPSHGCPPPPTQGCPTQFPNCQATDVACGSAYNPTKCNCGSSPGDFLCEVGTFGGGGF